MSQISQPQTLGIVIVDHGSRRRESNEMLEAVVEMFRRESDYRIVEAAHMELAAPSIADAVDRCVRQGAARVLVFPYFLSPGRHWSEDIPRLAREAASKHDGLSVLVTAPIGIHAMMMRIIDERIQYCLQHAQGENSGCDQCAETDHCRFHDAGE